MPGIKLLRIDFRTMGQRPSFWVQPDKGFVLRKVEFVRIEPADSKEVRHARYGEVSEIVEAAPGIWYPKRSWFVLESTASLDSSVRFIRTTSTSGSVTINDPRVVDSDFLPEIPPLYGVTDQVNNELWRATPDGQVYRERMDQRIGEARAAAIEAHRRAATQPASPDQPGTTTEAKLWSPAAIGIATGTVVLLVISVLTRLRRMRATSTIAVVMAIGIMTQHPEAATAQVALSTTWTDLGHTSGSNSDPGRGQQSQPQKLNCGLDVA